MEEFGEPHEVDPTHRQFLFGHEFPWPFIFDEELHIVQEQWEAIECLR